MSTKLKITLIVAACLVGFIICSIPLFKHALVTAAANTCVGNLRQIDGTVYCNTGDWVESCSALIETLDGELQLLRWPNGRYPARRTTTQLVADAA